MRIKVRYHITKKQKYNKINISLPNFLIKSKLLWKQIIKHVDDESLKDIAHSIEIGKKLYKAIKNYIKLNGHFVFLEVQTKDTFVKIII